MRNISIDFAKLLGFRLVAQSGAATIGGKPTFLIDAIGSKDGLKPSVLAARIGSKMGSKISVKAAEPA